MTDSQLKRKLQTCGMETFVLFFHLIKDYAKVGTPRSLNDVSTIISRVTQKTFDGSSISAQAGAAIFRADRDNDALDLIINSKSHRISATLKEIAGASKS